MTKTSKKIILSVLALVLTVIALGTTTFAWFSIGTVSKISNISGTVRGGEGMDIRLVSLDNPAVKTPWRTNISESDWNAFILALTGKNEFILNGVSTKDNVSFTKMDTVDNGGTQIISLSEPATKNVDYLEFTIEFRSPTDGKIHLNGYEFSGGANPITFTPENAYNQYEDSGPKVGTLPVETSAANGARFSLYNATDYKVYQHPGDGLDDVGGTIKGNTVMTATTPENFTFGQWSYLTDAKEMELYYYDDGNSVYKEIGNGYNLNQITFLNALTEVEDSGVYYSTVNLTETGSDPNPFEAKFVIRIWIEGWDADTYDAFYNGELNLALSFIKELLP